MATCGSAWPQTAQLPPCGEAAAASLPASLLVLGLSSVPSCTVQPDGRCPTAAPHFSSCVWPSRLSPVFERRGACAAPCCSVTRAGVGLCIRTPGRSSDSSSDQHEGQRVAGGATHGCGEPTILGCFWLPASGFWLFATFRTTQVLRTTTTSPASSGLSRRRLHPSAECTVRGCCSARLI